MPSVKTALKMGMFKKNKNKKKKKTQVVPHQEPNVIDPQAAEAPFTVSEKAQEETEQQQTCVDPKDAPPEAESSPEPKEELTNENPCAEQNDADGAIAGAPDDETIQQGTAALEHTVVSEDRPGETEVESGGNATSMWSRMFSLCSSDTGLIHHEEIQDRLAEADEEEWRIQLKLVEFIFFSNEADRSREVGIASFAEALDKVFALKEEELLRFIYKFFTFVDQENHGSGDVDLSSVSRILTKTSVIAETTEKPRLMSEQDFLAFHMESMSKQEFALVP